MARRFKPLHPLQHDQARAADPSAHATLSASAGTGKTQVLTARVLRLLIQGVRPETILCLTFTKAGAAEMANRIGARLASWVRLDDAKLRKELFALREPNDPPTLQRARRLFARVLDAPGGLRIQTIHSFAQTLLGAFPAEAGIAPDFRPIEGREEQLLARRTLAQLAADAEAGADPRLIPDLQMLSRRLGERETERYLMRCARAPEAMAALASTRDIEAVVLSKLDLPLGDVDALLAEHCSDSSFDCAVLHAIAAANRGWGARTGLDAAERIEAWLALPPAQRCTALGELAQVVFTQAGERRKVQAGLLKAAPDAQEHCDQLAGAIAELLHIQRGAAFAAEAAAGLRAGAAFAETYTRAKRAAGVADFDDLIRWTWRLLAKPGMGEWVRYKLDRRTDHILVDEAQDTNAEQWDIVRALAAEYFAGEGASSGWRTLFMVGDFKQAIFSFQGTDPREFERASSEFAAQAEALRHADADGVEAREFRQLSIDASFRSAQAVLEVVDAVIAEVGAPNMGLPERPNAHRAFHLDRPGGVELWKAFEPAADEVGGEEDEEGWIEEPVRRFAAELARQVRAWLDEAPELASTGHKLGAGDILILVRSRGELASLIVARLFAEGVPVAGIDRLHLSSPLAVRDLIAAIAFAVQPLDDLNLANLLVSPLLGWTQEQLYDLAFGRAGRLWEALGRRAGEGGHLAAARATLVELLRIADYVPPARFIETILSGPMDGRYKLLHRLGPAARDPIAELLSAALEFERQDTASLDRFLAWFSQGDVEIKRDPSAPSDAVRVMTVHGAKGLEAPVVILADATADPANLGEKNAPVAVELTAAGKSPMIRPRKAELMSPLAEIISDNKLRDIEEHWRLLYVGLTRAAERLVVAGVEPKRGLPADSWYEKVRAAMEGLGAQWIADERWGARLDHHGLVPPRPVRSRKPKVALPPPAVPEWARTAAPPESRPPRPLAPSALAEDRETAPPPNLEQRAAAHRGTLIHALLERLPGVAAEARPAAAVRWLEHSAGVALVAEREQIAGLVCGVLGDERFGSIFGPESLAEAPIAATLPDGRVVAGTVDRLLVEPGRVSVIDFKTGRVPASETEIPAAHRRQMAAYAEALAVIFPDRPVRSALLYTAQPLLIEING
jgi:ATP-dependent helicase/nuclease subunit A